MDKLKPCPGPEPADESSVATPARTLPPLKTRPLCQPPGLAEPYGVLAVSGSRRAAAISDHGPRRHRPGLTLAVATTAAQAECAAATPARALSTPPPPLPEPHPLSTPQAQPVFPELPESPGARRLSPDSPLSSPGVKTENEAAELLQAPLHTSSREADPPSSRHTVAVATAEAPTVVDVDAVFLLEGTPPSN